MVRKKPIWISVYEWTMHTHTHNSPKRIEFFSGVILLLFPCSTYHKHSVVVSFFSFPPPSGLPVCLSLSLFVFFAFLFAYPKNSLNYLFSGMFVFYMILQQVKIHHIFYHLSSLPFDFSLLFLFVFPSAVLQKHLSIDSGTHTHTQFDPMGERSRKNKLSYFIKMHIQWISIPIQCWINRNDFVMRNASG